MSYYSYLAIGGLIPHSSTRYHRGRVIKVDKFIFHADFIILDMEEDKEVPSILGRPFLVTGRELIDVQKGELRLRVQEDEVTFSVFNATKHLHDNDSCFRVDEIEAKVFNQLGSSKPLETSLTHEDPSSCEDDVGEMDGFFRSK